MSIGSSLCHRFADSHCHVRPATDISSAGTAPGSAVEEEELVSSPPAWVASHHVLCATEVESDWDLIAKVLDTAAHTPREPGGAESSRTTCIGGFGVHPWFTPLKRADAMAQLELLDTYLHRYPSAIVGEIGLDALKGPPMMEKQLPFFIAQLRVAAAHSRPVSVHCVRAHAVMQSLLRGDVLRWEEEEDEPQQGTTGDASVSPSATYYPTSPYAWQPDDIPPAIIFHGFSGSREHAQAWLRMKPISGESQKAQNDGRRNQRAAVRVPIADRLYFGVGWRTLRLSKKGRLMLPLLYDSSRMVAETDEHYAIDNASPGGTKLLQKDVDRMTASSSRDLLGGLLEEELKCTPGELEERLHAAFLSAFRSVLPEDHQERDV